EGDLLAALAGRELILGQRRVAGAEVDRAGRDRRDARAASDRAVRDLGRLVLGLPLRDQRRDERTTSTLQAGCVAARRGKADPEHERCRNKSSGYGCLFRHAYSLLLLEAAWLASDGWDAGE